ncbi:Delta(14)-sterol reductase [Viridothelium virens]|uniref:Delta(14)-sterol reductase n=1 Tax=Viridothelium virens TaxID=1048519 RepID=A0A6A6GYY4_VIRVR|nr:Delta(14)-sterol reductase [Viridothelium virens]
MPPKKRESASESSSSHGYEFGGPLGALVLTLGLPILCYMFAFLCNDISGCPAPSLLHPRNLSLKRLSDETGWQGVDSLINRQSVVAVTGYYLLSLTLNTVLPSREVEGTELRSGGRLKYKFNAFSSAVFIMVIAAAGTVLQGADFPLWTFIYDNYVPILTTNLIISYALATYVYVASFSVKKGNKESRELALGGHTGNAVYDFFIGRELNPRVKLPFFGEIDIKAFMELRPGMLGWILLDLAFTARQYKNYGYITDSIVLVNIAQAVYVFDALWMESAILTTIDIITDGFGFMLAFGDLVWLPFTYSIQARYLSVHPVTLGISGSLGVVAVQLAGYYIFRATNNEKNLFRTNPNDPRVAHLQYIETKSGSRLLTTGWWGRARHINYLGDWLMSWSYCLPTGIAGYIITKSSPVPHLTGHATADGMPSGGLGVSSKAVPGEAMGWGMIFTYFYMLYFAVLLLHRERRDEEKCRRKYGKDWDRYCEKVRYRIIPYVY